MHGLIIIKKAAVEDPMLLEWLQNRDLYEQWEKECKPARLQSIAKKPKAKKTLKVEVPLSVE